MRFDLCDSFHEERARWTFHHTCEFCAHYHPALDQCVHRYPVYDPLAEAERGQYHEIFYCKEFEHL